MAKYDRWMRMKMIENVYVRLEEAMVSVMESALQTATTQNQKLYSWPSRSFALLSCVWKTLMDKKWIVCLLRMPCDWDVERGAELSKTGSGDNETETGCKAKRSSDSMLLTKRSQASSDTQSIFVRGQLGLGSCVVG
jgi:hypothetical protein